jgi:hypothetical protein
MATLQDEQAPIDRQIVEAVIDLLPETWESANLTVNRHREGENEKLSIAVTSPEGHKDLILPEQHIYDLLYQLIDCFARHGRVWNQVKYALTLDDDDNWHFIIDFKY